MDVCQHSGLAKATCTWGCYHCTSNYLATPSVAAIYAAAALIRDSWPPNRLRRAEGLWIELEIPTAHKVSDHMRRKPRQED